MAGDGSLTAALETLFGESIRIVKLHEDQHSSPHERPDLGLAAGARIINRNSLLVGSRTNRAYVSAKSEIAFDNLDVDFREALLHTTTPIGHLWRAHRVESFKELLHVSRADAGDSAKVLDIESDAPTLSRTYKVFTGNKCSMIITETIPEEIGELL